MKTPSDLAATLQALSEKHKLPGVVGAILHGDRIVALGSTGVRKAGESAPFLVTDKIHLGSDTKALTAILVGRLIDEGQLSFDTTMAAIFSDDRVKLNPLMAPNTVRNLLNQVAGFPPDLNWFAFEATHLSLPEQRRAAVEQALSVAPATTIGTFSYSNVSFVVLGAIIEAKRSKSWEEVIETEIFRPLQMTSAGFGPPGKVDQPWGHVCVDGRPYAVQIDNPRIVGPSGSVHCSIEDWAKFIAETLRGAQGHPTLVSVETFRQLTAPPPDQWYAGGWAVVSRSWAGGLALSHAGSNTTWYCNVWIAPNKDFAVLIAFNYVSSLETAAQAADEGVRELIDFELRLSAIDTRN